VRGFKAIPAGDEAAPPLADERGADEARGVVGREADEDLLHELLQQRRRPEDADRLLAWSGWPADGKDLVR